jgi:Xaa-Pro aminopeptidase
MTPSTLTERDFRWGRVRAFMDERGLDGLVVLGAERPGADHYLTNNGVGTPVIFPRHGDPVAFVHHANHIGQHLVSKERGEDVWVDDTRMNQGAAYFAEVLREKGLRGGRVGVVGTGFAGVLQPGGWANYRGWLGITQAMPEQQFDDVTWDFVVLMLEKSDADIARVRRAAAAGEAACEAMIESCAVGISESEIFANGMYEFARRQVRATWMILQSGSDNIGWTAPIWDFRDQPARTLEPGDVVMAELFPNVGLQEAQLQLCVAVGEVSPDHERCETVARQAYEAGLRALKPGLTFAEVCEAMEQPVRALGGWHMTPMIHSLNPLIMVSSYGLGIEQHVPEIAQNYPNVRGRDLTGGDVVIKPNMAFAFEPNAHLGRTRVNIGGTVVVTEHGCEELNHISNRLNRVAAHP